MTAFSTPRRAAPPPPRGPLPPRAPSAAELEALLTDMLAHHERMLALAREHAGALRRADAVGVARAVQAQQQAGRAVVDLEARRARLVSAVAGPAASPAKVTLSGLAMLVPEPARTRLTALAARLKSVLIAADAQQQVVLAASKALLGHMQGLMAQVARSLTHAGTYSRPGPAPVSASAVVHSGLDVKS